MQPLSSHSRVDLLLQEEKLLEQASKICSFRTGHITFPRELPRYMVRNGAYSPVPVPEEEKLFIPLVHRDTLFGVLLLEGVRASHDSDWFRTLVPFMELNLENLLLAEQKHTDPLTGLLNQQALLLELEKEIELIVDSLISSDKKVWSDQADPRDNVSLLTIQVPQMESISRRAGYAKADRILSQLAEELQDCLPPSCLAARLENHRLGAMLARHGKPSARMAGERILSRLNSLAFRDPVTEEELEVTVHIGLSVYPGDIHGPAISSSIREKAGILLANALRALHIASVQEEEGTLFSFSSILSRGGRIDRILTGDRVIVDLGRKDKASEGHTFSVFEPGKEPFSPWPAPAEGKKAELMLIDTYSEQSLAEVLYRQPGTEISPGDPLSLRHSAGNLSTDTLPSRPAPEKALGSTEQGVLSLPRFLSLWQHYCLQENRFVLALCKMRHSCKEKSPNPPEQTLHIFRDRTTELVPQEGLTGSYGSGCFILYLPGTTPEEARNMLTELSLLQKDYPDLSLYMGIGYYPCLNYTRLEIAETARLALEHAQFLPPGSIALFDSLSLTISADRHYAAGDLSEAISAYKQALLMDSENSLARNSLAICYARIGSLYRAQQEFTTLLQRNPEEEMVLYNHGCVSLKLEQLPAAEESFRRCLQLQPQHHFSLLRLGQIREKMGDSAGARDFYHRVLDAERGSGNALKHLGRLDYQKGDPASAREKLQKALKSCPWDAEALHLLARIYLEAGEDPELVESLARKSYSLRPGHKENLQLLEEMLIANGKKENLNSLRAGSLQLGPPYSGFRTMR